MLALHWSPAKNTKKILKTGITKSKIGLYCFPLTNIKSIDTWWAKALKFRRGNIAYNGFIFKISNEDFPAYFNSWKGGVGLDDFKNPINNLIELRNEYDNLLALNVAKQAYGFTPEIYFSDGMLYSDFPEDKVAEYIEKGKQLIKKDKKQIHNLLKEPRFVHNFLSTYQLILSNSIPKHRIEKVIPFERDYGKISIKEKKYKINNYSCDK